MDNLDNVLLFIKNKLDKLTKDVLIMYLSLDYCPGDVLRNYYNNDSDIKLCLSINTVKTHIASLLQKTEFDSVHKLAIFAVSKGYIITNNK